MKVLVTGAGGQLGRELAATCPGHVELTTCTRQRVDITREQHVRATLEAVRPDLVINAAAYTAVDRAEDEAALAFAVNAEGAGNLALATREMEVRLFHLSTDFVFSGESSRPYSPEAETDPRGVYGASKLAGEERVLEICSSRGLVVRTAWVYSRFGHNFVKTMLRVMSERREITVVADQVGAPTWARGLAELLWACSSRSELAGILHWTDNGVASWYDLAVAIQEEAEALGFLSDRASVSPIATADYPTAAERPAFSVLDTGATRQRLGISGIHWRQQLRSMLRDLQEYGEE